MTERRAELATAALFVATIFGGSFLLFMMQPMVARMALPRLGGAPAVWNSAMLVYQALLLAGYSYAHAIGRLRPRTQAAVHLAVFAFAALWLPVGLLATGSSATEDPVFWVPWLLGVSIGPLFFAISAQAPLMQRWFALRMPTVDPYPLYAASNLGSFAGLLAYPLLIEPALSLRAQSIGWSIGYGVLLLGVAVCATRLPARADVSETVIPYTPAPSIGDWARWIVLAAIPSGLMLSTTTHLTTDIIAIPLIWVAPLGLYLLSFTVAFSRWRRPAAVLRWLFPLVLVVTAGTVFTDGSAPPIAAAGLGLTTLLIVAVTLHRELYRLRPGPARLTAFYLALAVGGVIGGGFCALVAPVLFDWTYEHPILIALAAFSVRLKPVVPTLARLWRPERRARMFEVALAGGAVLLSLYAAGVIGNPTLWASLVAAVMIAVIAVLSIGRRWVFGVAILALMFAKGGWDTVRISTELNARVRSYFGVYTIVDRGRTRELIHGTTLHGVQNLSPERALEPTTYYAPLSGVGIAMQMAPTYYGPDARIGVVGLGTGTLACYARPGQDWRFYEIDPAIVRIATNPARFTFLRRCAPQARVLIGDARLRLAGEAARPHDVLVIDAFSSDAVPMHLLTLEAFEVYRRTLSRDGLLLVHVSNRYLDLDPVVAAAAQAGGWHVARRDYRPNDDEEALGVTRSIWIALSPDAATLTKLTGQEEWEELPVKPGFAPWTDDHASILPILKGLR